MKVDIGTFINIINIGPRCLLVLDPDSKSPLLNISPVPMCTVGEWGKVNYFLLRLSWIKRKMTQKQNENINLYSRMSPCKSNYQNASLTKLPKNNNISKTSLLWLNLPEVRGTLNQASGKVEAWRGKLTMAVSKCKPEHIVLLTNLSEQTTSKFQNHLSI